MSEAAVGIRDLCDAIREATGSQFAAPTSHRARMTGWERLSELATMHRVASLLDAHPECPPELRALVARSRIDAVAQAAELIRLVRAFREHAIDVLSYKGPILSMQAYGSPLLRVCSDLDLAIRPSDTSAALGVMHQRGYRDGQKLSAAEHACFQAIDGDYGLVHEETGALVELHCRVSSRRFVIDLESDTLFARSERTVLGGCEIDVPSSVDTLVVLAVHGAKHRWRRLEWIASFAAIIQRQGEDTAELALHRAAETGARRAFLLAVLLASKLFGVVPGDAAAAAIERDRDLPGLIAEVMAVLEAEGGHMPDRTTTSANLRFNFKLLERKRDRFRYCARWLFIPTPEDWRTISLPRPIFWLHRVLRPVRLLMAYVRAT